MENQLTFEISNFKSIQKTKINLRKGLNILVGPNGAGKTNVFSAIRFIKDVIHSGAALAIAKAGGPKRAYSHNQESIDIAVTFDYGRRIYKRKKHSFIGIWQFTITQEGEENIAIVRKESLQIFAKNESKDQKLFGISINRTKKGNRFSVFLAPTDEYGRDLFRMWERDFSTLNKNKIHKKFLDLWSEFGKQLKSDSDKSFLIHLAPLDNYLSRVIYTFRRLNEYNILPNTARASIEQLPYAMMNSDGGGVAEVIDALEKKTYHKIEFSLAQHGQEEIPFFDFYRMGRFGFRPRFYYLGAYHPSARFNIREREGVEKALDRIQKELSSGVQPITGVTTQIDQTNGKRFVVFNAENDVFYPEEVSDGTIKWLCILVSIYVPNARCYLLEEPENFLHPWMQQRLIENMRIQAEESNTYYLLTSHSTTILNASYPQELRIVKPTESGTVVEEIADVDAIEDALIESGFGLGDLWVSGAIEGVPTYEG